MAALMTTIKFCSNPHCFIVLLRSTMILTAIRKKYFLFQLICVFKKTFSISRKIVAYVLGSYLYNWSGKCFHMEDIYVKSSHRKLGVGEKMFKHLIEFVKNEKCDRIEFHMVKGNPAQRFYEKMKATNVTTSVGYQYYRLYNDAINSIVENQCI